MTSRKKLPSPMFNDIPSTLKLLDSLYKKRMKNKIKNGFEDSYSCSLKGYCTVMDDTACATEERVLCLLCEDSTHKQCSTQVVSVF